jgi:hypothetical protein
MPGCLSSTPETDLLADRIEVHFREQSFGLHAGELRQERLFVSFLGLAIPRSEAHFTLFLEMAGDHQPTIGAEAAGAKQEWRLSRCHLLGRNPLTSDQKLALERFVRPISWARFAETARSWEDSPASSIGCKPITKGSKGVNRYSHLTQVAAENS